MPPYPRSVTAPKRARLWPVLACGSLALAGGGAGFLPELSWNAALFPQARPAEVVPTAARQDAPVFFPPAHLRAVLGLPPSPYGIETEVRVYPVEALLEQYPERGRYTVRRQLETLRGIVRSGRSVGSLRAAELPFLYSPGADLVVAGSVERVATPSLRGVRYLGVFAQEVRRFAREDVRYTFQGLSADGRYYLTVNASLPDNPLPPRDELQRSGFEVAPQPRDSSKAEQERYERAVSQYFSRVRRELDRPRGGATLARLDALVRSLRLRQTP